MSLHRIHAVDRLPISLDEAWAFFSDPQNLSVITPPDMGFEITGEMPERMYPGLIITYRVRPLLGIPTTWVTEIAHVQERRYFVDEQRIGPYRLWHHQHHFRAVPGGVEVADLVHYTLPGGPIGDMVHAAFVRRRLRGIFDFRTEALRARFGAMEQSGPADAPPGPIVSIS